MHGVRALDNVECSRLNPLRRGDGKRRAVEAAVVDGSSLAQRDQHLFQKALAVDVAAGLREARLRALLGPEEKVVHVEDRAAVNILQQLAERRLAAGAAALDGDEHAASFRRQAVDARKQRQRAGEVAPQDAVRGRVILPKYLGVVQRRKAVLAPPLNSFRRLLRRKRQLARVGHCLQGGEHRFELFAPALLVPRREGEEPRKRLRAQAVLQNAEVHTAVVAAEQLDELGDTVTASRRFGADVVCGGGRVGDQMLAAKGALIERLEDVLKRQLWIARAVGAQKVANIGKIRHSGGVPLPKSFVYHSAFSPLSQGARD